VLLLDSVGELAAAFRHASVVFMGGSLVPRGGHNILEPAAFAKPIIFGPHMENFREIRDMFVQAQAAVEVNNAAELARAVEKFLTDTSLAATLGSNARDVVAQNTGATERVLAYLQ
jgi:3-deoxy-D-manno-octulosonic-acid transferase